MAQRTVVVGCDHAAVDMKNEIAKFLKAENYNVIDVGTDSTDSVDYPDYSAALCARVVSGEASLGFLFCGSGVGVSIAANKVNGIRAALCYEHYTAKMAREHNDANVMCAGARVTGIEVVKDMVQTFLATPFAGGKHANRVEKIMALQTQKHE
jgi:ribose 5-phosphate isomerase B